ncbi:DUF418 domain-containing protein [Pseudoduganella sp. LjRoot289]|uniref:DUF418 domain-containing protein n=1 Tax=Pseudoduganella sp. LjRoot289 TaxID=3342314 RepID=UPI003ECD36D3
MIKAHTASSRLDVIDALRGFAIVSIMLVHNLEHFDLIYTAQGLPAWMKSLDSIVWDMVFFLFSGKSYAIFSLLFGVTFFIQLHSRQQRGEDFRPRFAWRLALLFGFGLVNSLFYEGDILTFYAVVGLVLIPVARLGNKAVFAIALLLMLQPAEWLVLLDGLQHPELKPADPPSWAYFGKSFAYLSGDSVLATWYGNFTNGKMGVLLWSWENGRMFQMPSLFMLGMLAGRMSLFVPSPESRRFWTRTLLAAALLFVPLLVARSELGRLIASEALRSPLWVMLSTWSSLALMLVLVSSFVLLFQTGSLERMLRIFAPLGRMSLTSYVTQSLVGSFIYYGYGLGLYKITGASHCLLIGLGLALLQGWFSVWWLNGHKQGPLEALWHRATWAGRRADVRAAQAINT